MEVGLFWIASYPKSGNTWARCLIDSLCHGGAAPDLEQLHWRYPQPSAHYWLEAVTGVPASDLSAAELVELRRCAYHALVSKTPLARLAAPGVRFLKVHDSYDPGGFPPALTAGAVYLVRDPRDVALSWASHSKVTVEETIAEMARRGKVARQNRTGSTPAAPVRLGSWSEHVLSWIDDFKGPLLVLRYEDLLADPHAVVGRFARFLGLPATASDVAAAVAACGFSALASIEATVGFPERAYVQQRFFRQGKAGSWRDDLTSVQAAALVAAHGAVMERLGYLSPGSGFDAAAPLIPLAMPNGSTDLEIPL